MSNINSEKIKIFPIAKERLTDTDPHATLFTEKNMSQWLDSIVDTKAFVISGSPKVSNNEWVTSGEDFIVYVKGYIIKISKSVGTDTVKLCDTSNSTEKKLYISLEYSDSTKSELAQDTDGDESVYKGVVFSSTPPSATATRTESFLLGKLDGEFVPVKHKFNYTSVKDSWQESLEIITISCIHP